MRPEVKHHAVYFSLCQAVFYIFVFRHKSLTEMPGGIYVWGLGIGAVSMYRGLSLKEGEPIAMILL